MLIDPVADMTMDRFTSLIPRALRLPAPTVLMAALALAVAGPVRAQTPKPIDLVSFYQTDIRALAMGNAYGPVARGEGALLYNPAGLAQYDLDIKIEASLDLEGTSTEFLLDTQDLLGAGTTSEVQAYLDKYEGTTHLYRVQTFHHGIANLAKFSTGLGGGLMDVRRYRLEFQDPLNTPGDTSDDELHVELQTAKLTFGAAAVQMFGGRLLMGVTGKSFTFTDEQTTPDPAFSDLVTQGELDFTLTGDSYKATAYDFGFIWRLETFSALRGQWSTTVFNVGGLKLTDNTTSNQIEIPQTVNVGLSLNPKFRVGELLLTVEVEDVGAAVKVRDRTTAVDYKRSLTQRTHAGLEYGLFGTTTGNHIVSLRAGVNRGQGTYGAELNLFSVFRAAYTHYGDDLGHENESEIVSLDAVHLGVGFGF